LAAGCGKSEGESAGTGGTGSGGWSANGGLSAVGGSFQTGGSGGSSGVVGSGGSASIAGSAGSASIAGSGGSASVAGAAGHASGGSAITDGGAGGNAGAADAGAAGLGGDEGSGGVADGCSPALPLKCGDSVDHSTVIQGRPNTWFAYSSTARGETGRETIYTFSTTGECAVVATLKNLTTDLDLLLVPTCDSISSEKGSSTPIDIQTVETVGWTNPAGKAVYVVVDGYAGAEGTYTLEVQCTCN
jgi:hypothetical protein